jgi:hypothetical protein
VAVRGLAGQLVVPLATSPPLAAEPADGPAGPGPARPEPAGPADGQPAGPADGPERPRGTAIAVAFWPCWLVGGSVGSAALVAVLCAAVVPPANLADAGRLPAPITAGRVAAAVTVPATVFLLARADIHGAALAAALGSGPRRGRRAGGGAVDPRRHGDSP